MTPDPADEGTGAAPAPGAAPTLPSPSPSSPAVAWREIGRGERGTTRWVTWIGFADDRGGRGGAFYRSMVVADDAIEVAVEREPLSGAGAPRPVHRGRCGPPPPDDAKGIEERIAPLLAAADEAAARVARADASRARPRGGAQPDVG
jgi:hypothetical protein